MRLCTAAIAMGALLLSGEAAAACELPPGDANRSPLQTRKPVVGDKVRITYGFGMRQHPLLMVQRLHTGVDWAAPIGTGVVAAGQGRVVFAKTWEAYGKAILIDHGAGWQTLYSQLSSMNVREGDCVAQGAPIGKVGITGLSTGPHLHFEVRRDGQPVDPMTAALINSPSAPEK
jgi:murein DD-endopeptidase MepM/ murein hydrolase activator NlpD